MLAFVAVGFGLIRLRPTLEPGTLWGIWGLFIALGILALLGVFLWVYAGVYQGRRVALIVVAVFGALGTLGSAANGTVGANGAGGLWSLFLLVYSLARLGGWGPKPE